MRALVHACKRRKAAWEVSWNDDEVTILNSNEQLRRSENGAKISLATPSKKVAEKCAFSKILRMRCSIAQSTSHPSTLNIMKPDFGQNRSCDCHHATRDESLWKICRPYYRARPILSLTGSWGRGVVPILSLTGSWGRGVGNYAPPPTSGERENWSSSID